jgi:predicted SAM-dependent methyltransferase
MSVERLRLAALLEGDGIEIGALHRPLPVPARAHVTYVDRIPVEELREHYKELAELDLSPVDVIGSADDLAAFADASLDFVVANHLIEHLEDPIRALKEFQRVLRRRGLLFMCIPDARVTFDRLRPLTTPEHLIGEHRGGPAVIASHRRDHYVDWVVNVEDSGVLGELDRPVTASSQEERVRKLSEMDYSIHFHCWHASTFLDFFERARQEEGLELETLDAVDTAEMGTADELILLIGKRPSRRQRVKARQPAGASRSRLLKEYLKASPAGPALVRGYHLVRR